MSAEEQVPAELAGARLDEVLAALHPARTKAAWQKLVRRGAVRLDGRRVVRSNVRVSGGARLRIEGVERESAPAPPELVVLHEDPHLAVVDKPAGLLTHGNEREQAGTLAELAARRLGRLPMLMGEHRPGIVHRLDRDTSGVILVARHDRAHAKLAAQFEARSIEKEYFALVAGCPDRDRDIIQRSIGAHPLQREKMAIRSDESVSRPARTFYEVIDRFEGFAALRLLPRTGRTHQLRVHLSHIGSPVLCDRQYGGRARITRGEIRRDPQDTLVLLQRQALHARRLRFAHPETGEPLEIEAPLPDDIAAVLAALREFRSRS